MNELSPQARALIDEARHGEGLTGARRARIRGALVAQFGAGAAVSTGTAIGAASTAGKVAGGSSFALATAAKVVATVALVSGVSAGGLAVAVHALPDIDLPGRPHVALHGSPSVAARGAPNIPPPANASALVAPPSPNSLPATPPAAAAVALPASLPAVGAATLHPAAATRLLSAPVVSPTPNSLDSETRLLRDASFELRAGRPERALALLDKHERSFSGGALVEERRVERILALCALGRAAEAQAEGASFLRERPRSLLADRVRASCGGGAPEGANER
jgi:hypothetical protein